MSQQMLRCSLDANNYKSIQLEVKVGIKEKSENDIKLEKNSTYNQINKI